MDIKKYVGYFHDGSVISIHQDNDKIIMCMESCEILPEWGFKEYILSDSKTIRGKLIFHQVESILINDKQIDQIERIHEEGEILKLRIYNDYADLIVVWHKYPLRESNRYFEEIVIKATKIEWENIPDMICP